jgi:hypothetical protein
MKGDVVCILVLFQKLRKIKKYLLEKYCQEVLTLHLLTITLRRHSNPPGFFFQKHETFFQIITSGFEGMFKNKNEFALGACKGSSTR